MGFLPLVPNPSLPLAGGTVTGFVNFNVGFEAFGLSLFPAGTSTAAGSGPTVLTPANANGTAAQLTDTQRDYMVYLSVGTAGTAFSVKMGPTAAVADTIYTASAVAAGQTFNFRLPAGWFWEWAATTATLAEQTAVSC